MPDCWEYHREQPGLGTVRLNELGAQGWELVCSTGAWLVFKRRAR